MEGVDLPIASKFERVIAYVIDMTILALPLMWIAYTYTDYGAAFNAYLTNPEDSSKQQAYINAAQPVTIRLFISYMAYCFFMEGSTLRATIGKKIMKQHVVAADGTPLSVQESLLRNSFKFISYYVFSLGFFWALFDRKGQGWHDKIARTYVVDSVLMDRRDASTDT